jgi:hypothetical protein
MTDTKTYTWVESHREICALLRQAHDALALTSYPPQRTWVGLTDEEIETLIHRFDGDPHTLLDEVNARLKEKNT